MSVQYSEETTFTDYFTLGLTDEQTVKLNNGEYYVDLINKSDLVAELYVVATEETITVPVIASYRDYH